MKKVIITEGQLQRLLEKMGEMDKNSIPEYLGSKVQTNAVVTDDDENKTLGKQTTADDFQSSQSIQNFWANGTSRANSLK